MDRQDDRPGYKRKRNRHGTFREYWVARAALVRRGYAPKGRAPPLRRDPARSSSARRQMPNASGRNGTVGC